MSDTGRVEASVSLGKPWLWRQPCVGMNNCLYARRVDGWAVGRDREKETARSGGSLGTGRVCAIPSVRGLSGAPGGEGHCAQGGQWCCWGLAGLRTPAELTWQENEGEWRLLGVTWLCTHEVLRPTFMAAWSLQAWPDWEMGCLQIKWGPTGSPNPVTSVFLREKRGRFGHPGGWRVTTEEDVRWMQLQA